MPKESWWKREREHSGVMEDVPSISPTDLSKWQARDGIENVRYWPHKCDKKADVHLLGVYFLTTILSWLSSSTFKGFFFFSFSKKKSGKSPGRSVDDRRCRVALLSCVPRRWEGSSRGIFCMFWLCGCEDEAWKPKPSTDLTLPAVHKCL